ncbi:MAG: glycoside hydrolase family 18 protein [Stellaceae bacterium]
MANGLSNLTVASVIILAISWAHMLNAYGESPDHTVAGYYISWGAYGRAYTPRDIDATKLTHIIYAFANIDKGGVTLGDAAADPGNLTELRRLKSKNDRLKILIAVGGWAGSKHFSDAGATEESRKRFAESAVVFVRNHGFDGIDLDWEYPVAGGRDDNIRRPEDRENFTLLLEALRVALNAAGDADGKRYLLTIAAAASEEYVANTELEKIAHTVDWVGLMSYDFAGAWSKTSGHNAPLYADPASRSLDGARNTVAAAVMRYLQSGVPPRKLLLGLPLFGRTWRGCNPRNDGEYQECSGPAKGTWEDGVLDYQDIAANYLTNGALVQHFNNAARVPFLFDASSGQFISYDDARSFRYKVEFLKEKRLAGAMYWEITADRKGSLLDLVARELLPDGR